MKQTAIRRRYIDPLDRGRIKVAQILLLALVMFVVFCVFTVSGHRGGFFEVQSRWRPRLLCFRLLVVSALLPLPPQKSIVPADGSFE